MDDAELIARIEALVQEEHSLREREEAEGASGDERGRIAQLEVALDRLWDLLRQRRALREAGRSPEDASLRDASTVEDYEQ
jgi:hypothetical protein